MKPRLFLVLSLLVFGASACRVAGPGILNGTVCDADARDADLEWWTQTPPLTAMDRVTAALKLKVQRSEQMNGLREAVQNSEACRKAYFDGYTATHERVQKVNAELDAFRAKQPKGAPYDPALAKKSFDAYCLAAWEMDAFTKTVEDCIAGR